MACGAAEHSFRKRLLRDADLTFTKTIDAGIAGDGASCKRA